VNVINKTNIGKHLSNAIHIQKGLKYGDALSPLISNFVLECTFIKIQESEDEAGIEWDISISGWSVLIMLIIRRKHKCMEQHKHGEN
jgi:hypothetical protein